MGTCARPGQNHSTQDSRVVPHRGTNWAALRLTAQIRRDAVLSESYGRGCKATIHSDQEILIFHIVDALPTAPSPLNLLIWPKTRYSGRVNSRLMRAGPNSTKQRHFPTSWGVGRAPPWAQPTFRAGAPCGCGGAQTRAHCPGSSTGNMIPCSFLSNRDCLPGWLPEDRILTGEVGRSFRASLNE